MLSIQKLTTTTKKKPKQKTTKQNNKKKNQKKPEETLHKNALVLKANSAQICSKYFFCPSSLTTAKYYFRVTKGPLIWLSHMLSCY